MDKIIFSGNVGKQPEFQSKDGKDYCRFTVAVNHKIRGEKTTEWRNVTVFGKQAEFVRQWVTKGRTVLIEGRPSAHGYKNNLEEIVASIDVIADSVELVGGGNREEAGQNGQAVHGAAASSQPVVVDAGEELPF